jgi:hypothetical protein
MAFDIELQSERGETLQAVADPKNLLHRLIEAYAGTDPLLYEIDWNGDTVFNRLQMPRFLSAWQELALLAQTSQQTKLVEDIRALAERCESGVHLYLKFIGD